MSAPPEAGLVAEALSLDGRTFHLEGPVDSPWVPGDLLVLSTRQGGQICAQLISKDQSSADKAGGLEVATFDPRCSTRRRTSDKESA